MARKLTYRIFDAPGNAVSDAAWDEILRLQHWYNSEFVWTAGRLMFSMYAVFPDTEGHRDEERLWRSIVERRKELRGQGMPDNEVVRHLEAEGLVLVKKGGYFDDCIASGFTRVAGNEWNAHLVCDFLLKCSRIARDTTIDVLDEGQFIKPGRIRLINGCVRIPRIEPARDAFYSALVLNQRVFAVVDPAKYDSFPSYQSTVADFNEMDVNERRTVLRDLHWLGFDHNFDINGDDVQGVDLNNKVAGFELDAA